MGDFEKRIAGLSAAKRELLRKAAAHQRGEQDRIQPRPRPEHIPLTFGQRRLWLLDQMAPGITAYNVPLVMWLEGGLDPSRLRDALQALAWRHETLRTVFDIASGNPVQKILEEIEVPWHETSASGTTPQHRREDALARARAEVQQPFDLRCDSMVRAQLISVESNCHLLIITFHHIAVDGWSTTLLLQELDALYRARTTAATTRELAASLPPPSLQIADVALWQQDSLAGEKLETQLDYWMQHLEGAPATIDLPSDRPRPAHQSFRGAQLQVTLPAQLCARLESLARQNQATLSMVFLAGFQTVLSRYTGHNDIVVAMGTAGRARRELESVIGFFINTLPVRTQIDPEANFAALLESVRDSVLGAMENGDAPLDRIIEGLRLPRSASHSPLSQVMYFFQSYPKSTTTLGDIPLNFVDDGELARGTAQSDLSLFISPGDQELTFEYSTDLFNHDTIERLAGHLLQLLNAAVEAPNSSVATIPMLTPAERTQLDDWNASTDRDLPRSPTLTELLRAQVARSPDSTALVFGERALSYRELDQRANALAHELRAAGVAAGSLVGVYVERSMEMLVALLAIIKAGGAYVPLDPGYPRDRLCHMLEESASRVLITQPSLSGSFPEEFRATGVETVLLADIDAVCGPESETPPAGGSGPDDLAYVIFTSGSTGRPKGVEISQRAAVNLLRSVARRPGMSSEDTLCAVSTLSFDIALFELVLPLTVGARIVLADRETARDGLQLRRLIDQQPITIMQATPSTWRMLLELGWRGTPSLRKIISTGEALPRELADRLLPCVDQLWNLYGPTEATVYAALGRVEQGVGPVLVGKPIDNTQMHIVDQHMQPTPIGVPGELLIGGGGLARGYRNLPAQTAEKFIHNPFSLADGARLYRSGDLALWHSDGNIEVVGRLDHQVKLRGFRIELGEIESVLGGHPAVAQAVVHCREDRPGDKRLVAYITVEGEASTTALREHLKGVLPDYMVPAAFVVLDSFPLTPNGKVDRKALPAPELKSANDNDAGAARTDEEAKLIVMWQELLGVARVDLHDDFFDLGGHSLLAVRLLARVQKSFAVDLPLRQLFSAPTLERFAACIAAERANLDLQANDLEALLANLEQISEEEASAQLLAEPKKGPDL